MANAKQEVLRLLGELPEDVSYEEIQYHIYVVEKIRKAREAVQAGEVLSQEEVRSGISKKSGTTSLETRNSTRLGS